MSADRKNDIDETRAVSDLSDAIAKAFKKGGTLDGYGFALWIIPPGEASSGAMISNVARTLVAEHVGSWMLEHKFALPVAIPPADDTPTSKPN